MAKLTFSPTTFLTTKTVQNFASFSERQDTIQNAIQNVFAIQNVVKNNILNGICTERPFPNKAKNVVAGRF